MPRPAPRPSNAGFTLVELMIAVVIMAIMVMAIAPSLSVLLSDNRQASAAFEIVKLARRARSDAFATGIAQVLRIQNTDDANGGFGLGTIEVHAGMNGKCLQTPWGLTFAPIANSTLGPRERFRMADFNHSGLANHIATAADEDRPVIRFEVRLGAGVTETSTVNDTGAQICYQPNGEIFVAAQSTHAANVLAVQTNPVLLTVRRSVDSVPQGVDRQVLFPVGNNARLR